MGTWNRSRNRGNFHGAIKATGLGRIKRDDLCRALVDDLNDVVRVPCALVGHPGCIDGTSHLGETRNPFDRLLEIDEIEPLHTPIGAVPNCRARIMGHLAPSVRSGCSNSRRKAAAFVRWHEPDDARVSSPDL